MNILVCLKGVSEKELAPLDAYALEAAAKIKDSMPDTRITCLCALALGAGERLSYCTLRNAVAIGADEGFFVAVDCVSSDDASKDLFFEDTDTDSVASSARHDAFIKKNHTASDDSAEICGNFSDLNPELTAAYLAAGVRLLEKRGLSFDMIFCGAKAPDLNSASVPVMLAERLKLPFESFASDAAFDSSAQAKLSGTKKELSVSCADKVSNNETHSCKGGTTTGFELTVTKEADGRILKISLPLPAVVSFTKTAENPRLASISGISLSQSMVFETLDVSDFLTGASNTGDNHGTYGTGPEKPLLPEADTGLKCLGRTLIRKDRELVMIKGKDAGECAGTLLKSLTEAGVL